MIIVIIGGGIVGLNCALELSESRKDDEIFVLEAEDYLGAHTSTRNSEVIHAGFNYPPRSMKSVLCIDGSRLTYELLKKYSVPHCQCGKWILAFTEKEEEGLALILKNASECGVSGVSQKSPSQASSEMPWLKPVRAALFSKTSGILDSSEYVSALGRILSNRPNCHVLTSCRVKEIHDEKIVSARGEIEFDLLINSAGLFSDEIYRMSGGGRDFEIRPFKGEYYLWRKGPIEGLVYPVPERFLSKSGATLVSSMGVHLHRSVSGDRFIGPSQLEMPSSKKTDYKIETASHVFAEKAACYFKNPPSAAELEPAQAGNRPKLFEDGKPAGDFVILREDCFIHLLGIESPGLTAAPAIAKRVAGIVKKL
jgi:L-2-hydroxyglutarate oxidase LhgO